MVLQKYEINVVLDLGFIVLEPFYNLLMLID